MTSTPTTGINHPKIKETTCLMAVIHMTLVSKYNSLHKEYTQFNQTGFSKIQQNQIKHTNEKVKLMTSLNVQER